MALVIGVRFNPATKVYYFSPGSVTDLTAGEYVVVETARGEEVGKVLFPPREVSDKEIVGKLKPAQRRASALDLSLMSHFQYKERDALARCQDKVQEHGLPMKIVRAEYNYDGSRLVFFFTAEKRVDFRKLVQDLARSFRARIELRQIGVRDEAKLIGGIGKCGRQLCCITWLTEFNPVSIKMAKQQSLPLSPMEISGVCGRLLCCLAYENEHYAQVKQQLPKRGSTIDTPHGRGKVTQVNVIQESVQVQLENQINVEVSYQELSEMGQTQPKPKIQPKPQPEPKTPSRRRGRRRRRSRS
jgi:cell fate regulator YaaT (PSP1 superfamily)